jgi:hypothetical protein
VSELERKDHYDAILRDVITVLVEKCVNPETNRPYPPGIIERALKAGADTHPLFISTPSVSLKECVRYTQLIPQKVLALSQTLDECKPLASGYTLQL